MENKRDWYDYTIGIFIAIICAVIPLFVHYTNVSVSVSESAIRSGSTVIDVFSYYKSQMICLCGFCMAVIFLLYVPEKGVRKYRIEHPVFFCGGIFILFAIISLIMSPYKDIALKGISERFESVWVLISYMVFMIVAFNYGNTKFRMKFFVFALFAGIFIIGIVGVFQYFGYDFFETITGTKYILGDLYKEGGNPIKANFDEVYSFLYNPNCMGMFCAMILPFTATLAVSLPFKDKDGFISNILIKIFSFVLSIMLVYNLIGSSSEGGMAATAGAFFVGVIVALIYVIKNKKASVITVAVISAVVCVCGICVVVGSSQIREKISYTIDKITGKEQSHSEFYFQDFNVDSDNNRIEILTFENNDFHKLFIDYDENRQMIQISDDGGVIVPFDNFLFTIDGITEKAVNKENNAVLKTTLGTEIEFFSYLRKNNTIPFFTLKRGNVLMHFRLSDNGKISITNKDYEVYDINNKADKIGFEGNERFATGRGYIWSRSLPLILTNLRGIFVGNGPDSFALAFPQYEIKEKLMYLDNTYIIVDKPHNFYLQTAINTGLISLLAFLLLFGIYIYRTIRNILRDNVKDRFIISLRFAFLMGIIGYLISALATDSVVSVAPTFWVMLGIGFAVTEFDITSKQSKITVKK